MGVSDNCLTTGTDYPGYSDIQRRPPGLEVAGFPAPQQFSECVLRVTGETSLAQCAREVRPCRRRASRQACRERPHVHALEGKSIGHALGAFMALLLQPRQTFPQDCVGRIDTEAHHVQRLPLPGDGDLHTGYQMKSTASRCRRRLGDTVDAVVIGEREMGHTSIGSVVDEFGRRECAIGTGRVRVQIVERLHGPPFYNGLIRRR